MFGSHFSTLVDAFAKRFEPESGDYMFRSTLAAPGIRVSAAERNRFVADYERGLKRGLWTAMAVMVVGVLAVVPAAADNPDLVLGPIISAALILPGVAFVGWSMRLRKAPDRALAGRTASTCGRSKEEARRLALKSVTWGRLALVPVGAAFILVRANAKGTLLVGWNRLWVAFAALLLVLAAVQAVRKWLAERE